MNPAVRRPIRIGDEARFADRPIYQDELRKLIGSLIETRDLDLRIDRRTGTTNSRLGMARCTAIGIETRAQTGPCFSRHGARYRIHFLESQLRGGEHLLVIR